MSGHRPPVCKGRFNRLEPLHQDVPKSSQLTTQKVIKASAQDDFPGISDAHGVWRVIHKQNLIDVSRHSSGAPILNLCPHGGPPTPEYLPGPTGWALLAPRILGSVVHGHEHSLSTTHGWRDRPR